MKAHCKSETPDLTGLDPRVASEISRQAVAVIIACGIERGDDTREPVPIVFGDSLSGFERVIQARQAIEEELLQYRLPSV